MYKFALIGCGNIAKVHAEKINAFGKLVAVCDIFPSKADQLASQYQAKAYYDIDELLQDEEEFDIVCICTPVGCHAEHCIKSLQAGKHVLCESPLCLTAAAAWQMIETEKFCRKKLFVVSTPAQALDTKKQLSDLSGKALGFELDLAEVKATDSDNWRIKQFPGGGPLYSYFSNYIDALVQEFGVVTEASGHLNEKGKKDLVETDTGGEAMLTMKSGAQGRISWNLADKISTDKQNVSADIDKDYTEVYKQFINALKNQEPSNLYQSMRTVESIERIYKFLSPNPS